MCAEVKKEHVSCLNCKCGYWTMFDNEYGRYPVVLCYLHKDCGGDEAYPILEDEWVETAKDCKEFMNDNKDNNKDNNKNKIMSAEVKKELMKLIDAEDVKYLNQAIHNINESNRKCEGVPRNWDISDPREMEQHEYVFDDDNTPIPIDKAINSLIEYKDAGFTHVGYDDWDDALVAICYNTQSPADRANEIYITIESQIKKIKRNEMTNEKRLAKIEELKKQIQKLEEEMDALEE